MKKLLVISIVFMSCGSTSNQGWPYVEQKAYIESCIESFSLMSNNAEGAEEYCECALEKTISKYPTPEKSLNMDMNDILKIAEECLEEIR